MRETLISAGRRTPHGAVPHGAVDDACDVVARYRHRQAQRRALLDPPVPSPARAGHPVMPGVPAHPEGWSC